MLSDVRFAVKQNEEYATMPRTMLRYAIEYLLKEQREHYSSMKGKRSK